MPKNNKKKQPVRRAVKRVARAARHAASTPAAAEIAGAIKKMIISAAPPAVRAPLNALASLPMFMGHGDYSHNFRDVKVNKLIKGPAAHGESFGIRVPHRVKNREFVKNITSAGGGFYVDRIRVQPGLNEPFPLLHSIAGCYTRYKVMGLVYEFVPLVSDYTTTGQMGAVIMCFDLNVNTPQPTNKVAAEGLSGAISTKPSQGMFMGVECEHQNYNGYLVRVGDTDYTANTLEDYCSVFFCQSGLNATAYPSGTVVGELYVSYDIELYDLRLPYMLPGFLNRTSTMTTGVQPLGGSQLAINRMGVFANTSFDSYRIHMNDVPLGLQFQFTMVFSHAAGAMSIPTIALQGLDIVQYGIGGIATYANSGFVASSTVDTVTCVYVVTGDYPLMTFSNYAAIVNPTNICVIFSALAQGISVTAVPNL